MMMLSRRRMHGLKAQAAAKQRAGRPDSYTLPAPAGGWNSSASIAEMDERDAIQLDNWVPDFGEVRVRRGTRLFATVDNGTVATLAVLPTGSGEKLIAAANGKLFDVTSGGTISSSLASGFTRDNWQHAVMNDTLGLVNGADAPQIYDGSTVSAMTVSGSGLTIANLIGVNIFKSRSYFWEENSQDFWYSEVNAFGGSLTRFPLNRVGSLGGHLVTMITWTRDGGSGMDDLAVFLMSTGEAIIYQGSDPGDADEWSLVGVFQIGAPLGIRAVAKIGGDGLIASTNGYSLLSAALPNAQGAQGINISDKIAGALRTLIDQGVTGGYEVMHYPAARRIMVNHQAAGSSKRHQHVLNLATGAWSRFTGMEAYAWAIHKTQPYYGSKNGKIYRADAGVTDDGAPIRAIAQQAFTWLDDPSRAKDISMARLMMESGAVVNAEFGLALDLNTILAETYPVTLSGISEEGSAWDQDFWDEGVWGTAQQSIAEWVPTIAFGRAVAPKLIVTQSERLVVWRAISFLYKSAGLVG